MQICRWAWLWKGPIVRLAAEPYEASAAENRWNPVQRETLARTDRRKFMHVTNYCIVRPLDPDNSLAAGTET